MPEDVSSGPAAFYFDLVSPLAYLAAERVLHVLPGPAEWQPVLASSLPPDTDTDQAAKEDGEESLRGEVERVATELGLQSVRWPQPFPFDSSLAMRVATYAKSIGRTVPFAQAAFRQAYAGGHDLQNPDYVLIAAAACEMHPAAVLRGAEMRSVADALTSATAEAAALGLRQVPAVATGGQLFQGPTALEDAAQAMRAQAGVL